MRLFGRRRVPGGDGTRTPLPLGALTIAAALVAAASTPSLSNLQRTATYPYPYPTWGMTTTTRGATTTTTQAATTTTSRATTTTTARFGWSFPTTTRATTTTTTGAATTTTTKAPTTTTTNAPTTTTTTGLGPALKAPVQGVIDRNDLPPPGWGATDGGPINARVLRVAWADLQNSDYSIVANNPIDQALAGLPAGYALKVRLLAGAQAPGWLMAQAGSVAVTDGTVDASGALVYTSMVRWWTPPVKTAYDQLIAGLAARYDATRAVLDFTVSRCMTFFAEPLLRQLGQGQNVSNLWNAGLTAQLDEQCQTEAIAAHAALRQTRSSLAVNPYQKITSATTWQVDEAYTESLMDSCRSILAARCILGNNSLRTAPRSAAYDQMYAAIQGRGAPIAIQTAAASEFANCADLLATLDKAVSLGANDAELPGSYDRICTPADVAPKDQALEANPYPAA